MAKRCFTGPCFHYQKHQQAKYAAKSAKNKKKKIAIANKGTGLTLGKWFNMQISMMPRECENCQAYLSPYIHISQRAYIAHIVPKSKFVSVMLHPLNRIFLCVDCHSKFDNSLSKEVVQMNVWPIAVKRFEKILPDISQSEIIHLRPCFEEIYNLTIPHLLDNGKR